MRLLTLAQEGDRNQARPHRSLLRRPGAVRATACSRNNRPNFLGQANRVSDVLAVRIPASTNRTRSLTRSE
jgi:hypothetical protein